MNGKRCNRCGMVNTMDAVYCSNCGGYLDSNMNMNSNMNTNMNNNMNMNMNSNMNNSIDIDKQKANNMATISALLFYLGAEVVGIISKIIPVIGDLIYDMRGLCSIAGIVIMIIGRVKYPDNKSLKVVMWAIIVTIAVIIIFVVLYIVSVTSIIRDVSNSNNYGMLLPYRFW